MKMKDKYIEALETLQNPDINSDSDLKTWKRRAINIVSRIYGDNSKQEEQIEAIKFKVYTLPTISTRGRSPKRSSVRRSNNAKDCKKEVEELILSLIYDLKTFGTPEPKQIKNNGGINISLNQNQIVNVNVIWESIRDELKGSQLKEIEEIMNDEDETESKKKRIFDKIKSFGKDVATNIVAGILTNPAIYGV